MENKFKLAEFKEIINPISKNKRCEYLFECEPQKRTIIYKIYDPYGLGGHHGGKIYENSKLDRHNKYIKSIQLNKHYFRIETFNNSVVQVDMGEELCKDNDTYFISAYNFNNYKTFVSCGGSPYYGMPFVEKDFPKFLSMFWQSIFLHYNPNYGLLAGKVKIWPPYMYD